MMEEKQLQSLIKSNLRSLKNAIETNREAIEKEKEVYGSLFTKTSVNWKEVVEQEAKIAGLEDGLQKLKEYREVYFPNWKNILIED